MNKQSFLVLFILASLVYVIGLTVDIMGVDSSQYAAISREMNESGSYLQVTLGGKDYLDKPPLLFWVSSFFFSVFGYANWSFKIGSFLFTLLGVYSTFRLGKLLYSSRVGRLAAILLYTCQAFFLFNNDVRTDTILTGAAIFALWQLMEWLQQRGWKWLFGAALGLALAMLAKGPVGLMVPVLAVASFLVGRARWGDFFRWQYLVLIALIALMLMPMLYGLYQQFDAQPEKTVAMVTSDGLKYEKNVSGVRFYLWTQSFGRITGENSWRNDSGPLFFVHNLLWSFLPWALLFIVAFFSRLFRVVGSVMHDRPMPELLTLGGFLLPFIALSMSSYKLPHYIFILYPLAAILLASWWEEQVEQGHRSRVNFNVAFILQLLVALASGVVIYFIYLEFFPGAAWGIVVTSIVLFGVALLYFARSLHQRIKLITASVLMSLSVNFTLNAYFYPQLLQYQSGSQMARLIHQKEIAAEQVFTYYFHSFSFLYYLGDTYNAIANDALIESRLEAGKPTYLVIPENYLGDVSSDFKFKIIDQIGTHSVTLLNMKFLKHDTRAERLKRVYLLQIIAEK